jgi:hypothetical protein
MDPIELEAMLNSDNKEERIRARRLVRPRVRAPARDPFPIATLFATSFLRVNTRRVLGPPIVFSSSLPVPAS